MFRMFGRKEGSPRRGRLVPRTVSLHEDMSGGRRRTDGEDEPFIAGDGTDIPMTALGSSAAAESGPAPERTEKVKVAPPSFRTEESPPRRNIFSHALKRIRRIIYGVEPSLLPRTLDMQGNTSPHISEFVSNVVRNQKYNVFTFVPKVLYEQFRFFFNLYFLLVTLSQAIKPLKIGFLFTYIAPLAFVLTVTMLKEAYDDFKRYRTDRETNSQRYSKLTPRGTVTIPSSEIRVGDVIVVGTNQRVPADGILLRTTEKGGASFIRTDQLDGETDWKLRWVLFWSSLAGNRHTFTENRHRHAVPPCQRLPKDAALFGMNSRFFGERLRGSDAEGLWH